MFCQFSRYESYLPSQKEASWEMAQRLVVEQEMVTQEGESMTERNSRIEDLKQLIADGRKEGGLHPLVERGYLDELAALSQPASQEVKQTQEPGS